jgi:YhcH/YjgK/YiaL family protein
MIIDKIENARLYRNLSDNIKKALDFLQSADLKALDCGRHEISGEEIYLSKSEYMTKQSNETLPEFHRKYIDVQFVLSGEELLGYAPPSTDGAKVDYDDAKDIAFTKSPVEYLSLNEGTFAIIFPQELHQPGIASSASSRVEKIVVKVKA